MKWVPVFLIVALLVGVVRLVGTPVDTRAPTGAEGELSFLRPGSSSSAPAAMTATVEDESSPNSYSGSVVDEAGAPVVGAVVILGPDCAASPLVFVTLYRESELEHRATTDARGHFEFHGLEPRECWSVRILHPEHSLFETQTNFTETGWSSEAEGPFHLRQGAVVRGRVLDEAGLPISRARVKLEPAFSQLDAVPALDARATTSTTEGAFQFEHVGRVPHSLRVAAAGFGTREIASIVIDDDSEHELDVVLPIAGLIRGRVRSSSGEAIPGVRMMALGLDRAQQTTRDEVVTDEHGQFEFEALAPGPYNVLGVRRGWSFGQMVRARTGDMDLEFEAIREAEVRGRVVDAGTNRPLPEFIVRLRFANAQSPQGQPLRETELRVTDAQDGRFVLAGVLASGDGSWLAEAVAPDYAVGTSTPFIVSGRRDVDGVEIRMRTGCSLGGRLLTHTGKPVAGALVRACMEDDGEGLRCSFDRLLVTCSRTTTDAEGNFVLTHLAPVQQTLVVSGPDCLPLQLDDIRIPDEGRFDVGEILVARGGTIRGRVVDSSNTPRGACEVVLELRNAGQTLPRWTRSKSDGSFQFRTVPPGVHLVRSARRSSAGDAEPNDRESGVRGQLVSVEEGGEVADLELSVEP